MCLTLSNSKMYLVCKWVLLNAIYNAWLSASSKSIKHRVYSYIYVWFERNIHWKSILTQRSTFMQHFTCDSFSVDSPWKSFFNLIITLSVSINVSMKHVPSIIKKKRKSENKDVLWSFIDWLFSDMCITFLVTGETRVQWHRPSTSTHREATRKPTVDVETRSRHLRNTHTFSPRREHVPRWLESGYTNRSNARSLLSKDGAQNKSEQRPLQWLRAFRSFLEASPPGSRPSLRFLHES